MYADLIASIPSNAPHTWESGNSVPTAPFGACLSVKTTDALCSPFRGKGTTGQTPGPLQVISAIDKLHHEIPCWTVIAPLTEVRTFQISLSLFDLVVSVVITVYNKILILTID